MKQILKANNKGSFKLKVVITLFVSTAVVAFFFSLMFSGSAKKNLPVLHLSESINCPECSSVGGFYKDALSIRLSSSDPDIKIYYTTDGSMPSLLSTLYSKPIIIKDRTFERNYLSEIPSSPRWKPPIDNIFKGTILRAISVNENNNKSTELVRSFFVNEKGSEKYSLPVISITVNEKDLFGYNKGIYILGKSYTDKDNYIRKNIPLDLPWWEYPSNYLMRGDDAERPAHVEFYDQDGRFGFESNTGIRINGNATRGFAQKSLRICFRAKYGEESINYPLFPSNSVKKFNSFILRNSGNDWDKTMFRDAFMQSLMKNTHLDIQDYRPSIVFINGEYWGIHNIRERFDENYLVNKYHIPADSITILELAGSLSYGQKGDENDFKKILDFVKQNDLSDAKNYEFIKSKIDLESFSDFLIANIYFCNSDWPNNNVKFWRYKTDNPIGNDSIRDGRWRWMLYDTDWGFGYNVLSTPNNNLLEKAKKTGSVGILFSSLILNEKFLEQFVKRFQNHLNTSFCSPTVIALIDRMQQTLSPEMHEHIDRWRVIGSYGQWLANVEVLRNFAIKRPGIQAKQLNVFFNLQGDKRILLKK
jgi:hypothetical protein